MVEDLASQRRPGPRIPHIQDRSSEDGFSSQSGGNALEIIVSLTQALERAKTFFDSQPEWYQKHYPSSCISLSHDTHQAREDVETAEQSMVAMDVLRPAVQATRDVLSWVEAQFTACEGHVRSLKLRAGFLTLPDEILSVVLVYASHQGSETDIDDIEDSVKAATVLSHVCSRFRTLVLTTPSHWNRISSLMNLEAINTCFLRCGSAGVHIAMSASCLEEGDDYAFWRRISDEAHLWHHFAFQSMKEWHARPLEIWAAAIRDDQIEAPLLSELLVRYPSSVLRSENPLLGPKPGDEARHFYSRWSTPTLRTMHTENIIPVPFSGATSLTTLRIELNFKHFAQQAGSFYPLALAKFLSSCPVLAHLTLKISNCYKAVVHLLAAKVEIPSISSLTVCFMYCSRNVAVSLLDQIHFPNVDFIQAAFVLEEKQAIDVEYDGDIMETALSYFAAYPKLTDLILTVLASECVLLQKESQKPISIPIPSIPQLELLEIITWNTVPKLPPVAPFLPNLKQLSFENCKGEVGWFKEFCDEIRLQHLSGPPVELFIEGCPWESSLRETFKSMGDAQSIGLDVDVEWDDDD
ncbi:hypothetical protein SCHPADRAFT_332759 [Schizopora paradoxa]|uniref:Uncharacterized protein n=1 Tax=Schizopora paradoxa TaxID=27342 RepID=A0A0H2RR71_9AGAM|nr:hypothetical protein SCHPADRAFT_332759 [Schizopora paradoxa]